MQDKSGSTVFSATQIRETESELKKLGLTDQEIHSGALIGSLRLAKSGGMEPWKAAQVVGDTILRFSLSAYRIGVTKDQLAAIVTGKGEVSA